MYVLPYVPYKVTATRVKKRSLALVKFYGLIYLIC